MNKQEYQHAIKQCDLEIDELTVKRDNLIKQMNSNCELSLKEKLDNTLRYGKEDGYVIMSDHPLVRPYLANSERYETIDVGMMIESIFDSYQCETLEDHNEVEDIFDYPESDKENFEYRRKSNWVKIAKKEDFISLAEGIVEEGVSSFKFDW